MTITTVVPPRPTRYLVVGVIAVLAGGVTSSARAPAMPASGQCAIEAVGATVEAVGPTFPPSRFALRRASRSDNAAKPDTRPAPMPSSLYVAVTQSLARDASREYHIGANGRGRNPRHGLTLHFTSQGAGIETSTDDTQHATSRDGFTLRLDRFGRGRGEPVRHAVPRINGASAEYNRGRGLREWFVNVPRGVEQGWTVAARPAGAGPLAFELDTGRRPDDANDGELRWAGFVYRELVALDAHARRLPSRWVPDGTRLRIEVDDRGAAYPILVDPWIQQAKVVASDGSVNDQFGFEVALSGDTALVGAPLADAAYVFTLSGDVWSEQTKLTASNGTVGDLFGVNLVLSSDGNTAVVGAPRADVVGNLNPGPGAAYVFTRSGGIWSEQATLTASDGQDDQRFSSGFGGSVAISGDTVLVGAGAADVGDGIDQGAAYVFTRSGDVWSEQARLTASDGVQDDSFGSVAVSGDTALVGAFLADPNGDNARGVAYVFTRSDGVWSEEAKLIATDGAGNDFFGTPVVLSGDTTLIGASGADDLSGAAYVFTRSGRDWSQQAKLIAADRAPDDRFGASMALSGDTALVGAFEVDDFRGAAYVFKRSGESWTQQAQLTADDGAGGGVDGDRFGYAVALDGATALIGAIGADVESQFNQGAAYVFTLDEAPALVFEPPELEFGGVQVGATSEPMTVMLRNTGDGAATELEFMLSGEGFTADTRECVQGVAVNGTCDVIVTFAPTATGAASATLTVESAEGAMVTLAVSGTGVAPTLTFTPTSVAFGEVQVGTSEPMIATLQNTGTAPATELIFSPLENGFTADTSACGASLPAGDSCEVTVTFTPAGTGPATGTLTVASAEEATATLALSGTGVTPTLTFTPASLAFGDVPLGTTTEPMTAMLENTGDGAATELSFVAPGEGFEANTDACGESLPAGASCEVSVTFTPAAAGPVEGTLTVESAEEATATLDLSGGTVTFRYDFAEGATGYFTTMLGLFNPGRDASANVQVRLLPEGSEPIVLPITLTPFGRASVDVNAALGNRATGVAAVVTSDRPIAPIRQMSWDATTFGSTLESGAPGPSTTHYFAEGATTLWELFYLLSNDNDRPAQVTIEYLRDDGARISQALTVAAHSRQTVWVNAVPGMENTQAGAVIRSDEPIAAERSMYFTAGEAPWSAGASSRGAPAPDDTWYFAEGATEFFDSFLLLMNPSADTPATVDVRYHLTDGQTITTRHVVPAQSRRTILVEAEDPALADQLMAAMTVSAGRPIVAERAMWWGPTAASWYESMASVGSVESGTVWAIGEAWTGGPMAEDAFVLLANAASEAGQVRVTLVYDDQSTEAREFAVAANGRTTLLLSDVFPASAGRRFSVLVESLGANAVPIVVDVSRFQSTGGRFGNAGGSTTATRIR